MVLGAIRVALRAQRENLWKQEDLAHLEACSRGRSRALIYCCASKRSQLENKTGRKCRQPALRSPEGKALSRRATKGVMSKNLRLDCISNITLRSDVVNEQASWQVRVRCYCRSQTPTLLSETISIQGARERQFRRGPASG